MENTALLGKDSKLAYFVFFAISTQLPVQAFLLLSEPHDCFRCFGKDPNRIYSQYQLSKFERLERRMTQKFGSKTDIPHIVYDLDSGRYREIQAGFDESFDLNL